MKARLRRFPALTVKRLIAAVSLSAVFGVIANRPAPALASYDIELKVTGLGESVVGNPATAAQCTAPVNPNGYDLMVGTVTGNETSGIEEDIEYTGTLSRTTLIDFCELRSTGPREDQKTDCKATLKGSATMDVSLLVYGTRDRGAWLKARTKVGTLSGTTVNGDCDPPEMAQIQKDYPGPGPGMGGGGSPDGSPIEDRFSQPSPPANPSAAGSGPRFYVGGHARLRVGYYPPDPAAGGWSLWVKRKVP